MWRVICLYLIGGKIIMNGKTLYKSKDNRIITGVCGGIAEYFGWDASIVRIATAVLCAVSGIGIVAYIVGCVVMPEMPEGGDSDIIDM